MASKVAAACLRRILGIQPLSEEASRHCSEYGPQGPWCIFPSGGGQNTPLDVSEFLHVLIARLLLASSPGHTIPRIPGSPLVHWSTRWAKRTARFIPAACDEAVARVLVAHTLGPGLGPFEHATRIYLCECHYCMYGNPREDLIQLRGQRPRRSSQPSQPGPGVNRSAPALTERA